MNENVKQINGKEAAKASSSAWCHSVCERFNICAEPFISLSRCNYAQYNFGCTCVERSLPADSLTITNELNSVSLCFKHKKSLLHNSIFFSNSFSPVWFSSQSETAVSHGCIQSLLLKFSAQELIEVRQPTSTSSSSSSSSTTALPSVVVSVDHTKLWAMIGSAGAQRTGVKRKADDQTHHKVTSAR